MSCQSPQFSLESIKPKANVPYLARLGLVCLVCGHDSAQNSVQHGFVMARKAWSLVSAHQHAASCPALFVLSHRDSIGPSSCLHAALFCSGNFYSKCNTYAIPLLSSLEADSFKSYTGKFFSFTFHDFIITFFGRLRCEDLLHTIITPRGEN